jgi:putative ABC transport system permease protein
MSLRDTVASAFQAIISHRSRSLLTVLGILIGIAAVIVTVGLGEGSEASVTSAISSLGSNLLTVSPGSSTVGGLRGGLGSASSSLTMADATALGSHRDAPQVLSVAPVVQTQDAMQAGSETWTAPVIGSVPSYLKLRDVEVAEGASITDAEVTAGAAVAVLGSQVDQELFPGQDPIGQTVDIGSTPFQVVGILQSAGSSGSTNEDDEVIVPITTAQSQLAGSSTGLSSILLEATSSSTIGAAYAEADNLLLQVNGITNPADANFTITPESTLISTATSVSQTLTVLLAGIAAISLLVGGIGVMNIMLVSVTERIREIGLRMALGATPGVILRQFLTEALVLGLAGGLIGAALGVGAALLLPHFIGDQIELSWLAIVGSVIVAAGIGLIFGVYPASRASHLSPIEALRNE